MIGAGVVGGGVYQIIMNRLGGSAPTSSKKNTPIITKICVRDPAKSRDFHIDSSTTEIVTDIKSIVNDEEIDLVVEVMGGVGLAKEAVVDSLRRGKSVVTANSKAILIVFIRLLCARNAYYLHVHYIFLLQRL